MESPETSPEWNRRERREKARRRARNQRLAILASIPVALLAVGAGVKLGSGGGGHGGGVQAGSETTSRRRAVDRQRAREERAIDRVLRYTTFIASGAGRRREVALTFDDGPGVDTDAVLRILRRTGTPATFFVVGSMVHGREGLLRKIVRQGRAVGNHTESHPAMASLDPASQQRELMDQEGVVENAKVRQSRLFRPPYRSFNETTLELLSERRMLMVLWSVDTDDYEHPDPKAMAHQVLDEVEPGSIVLMHDGGGDRTATVRALPDIIKGLKKRKLKPVTVPRLVLDDPPRKGRKLPDGM